MSLFVGERVVGRGSDLYQLCKDIDDTIKGNSFHHHLIPFDCNHLIRVGYAPLGSGIKGKRLKHYRCWVSKLNKGLF